MPHYADLGAVAGLALAAGVLSLLPFVADPVRIALMLPFALAAPGYALTAALLPRTPLGISGRSLLTLGMSLAWCVILGMVLNQTGRGLNRQSWTVALLASTIAATAAAFFRRRSRTKSARDRQSSLPSRRQALLLGLAILVTVGAVAVARFGATREPTTQVTQLWMLPGSNADTVRLGVRNLETSTTTYRLRLADGAVPLGEWPGISLDPGATWEQTVTLSVTLQIGARVEAFLYRMDTPDTIYRQVALAVQR